MDEVKLPIIQDGCPKCGSKNGKVGQVFKQLVEAGKIKAGDYDHLLLQFALAPKTPPAIMVGSGFKVPIVGLSLEICADCNTLYVSRLDVTEQMAQYQMAPQTKPTRHS